MSIALSKESHPLHLSCANVSHCLDAWIRFGNDKAPLLQLPVFWYFSVDIRKIINGADPELAQNLTEGGLLWVRDLTEPDPWYGLPILGGLLLYMNVEVALGKQILSGEATSKANVAKALKDFFQSE